MVTNSTEVLGNTKLVQHGILNEASSIRAHVCVQSKTVWVFKTSAGVEAVNSGKWKKRDVLSDFQGRKIVTASGYLVPPNNIQGAIAVDARDLINEVGFSPYDDTSTKGQKAVQVVTQLLRSARFPVWYDPHEVTSVGMQVKGMDIFLNAGHIEVKCDWRGGIGEGTTGNLFLQYAECNPYRKH